MIKSRMYAALSATNEAILRTRAPEELFQRVCDAVVHGGGFRTAGAMLPDEDGWLRIVAIAGHQAEPIPTVKISIKARFDRGQGLAGTAFRTGQPAISNDYRKDYQNDDRFRAWRKDNNANALWRRRGHPDPEGWREHRRVPALRRGSPFAQPRDGRAAGAPGRKRFVRIEQLRTRSGTKTRRTGEPPCFRYVRGAQRDEYGHPACTQQATKCFSWSATRSPRAADRSARPAIYLKQPDTPWLKFAASAGGDKATIETMQFSIDPENEYGCGLHGPAFRNQRLVISYDVTTDPRAAPWIPPGTMPYGCAVAPLVRHGESVGILVFFFARTSGREDEGIKQLMMDIAENVSFGIDLFEREGQQQRLSRMFSTLSATNEAIMRARTRDELYQMVCEAAVKGAQFTSTTIFLAEPGNDFFRRAATAGTNSDIIQARRYSPRADFSKTNRNE